MSNVGTLVQPEASLSRSESQTREPFHSQQATEPDVIIAPERPALAPDVELVGEFEGSGFQDRQWLVNRGGHFIQVTELLYRILERADGRRSLAEIASEAGQASGWLMSAEQVRELIELRLIPLGLIASSDGIVIQTGQGVSKDQAFSPLKLNLRLKMFGPRFIDAVTSVLRVLHTPPVLAANLTMAALVHAWLYFDYGVDARMLGILYQPNLFLIVLGLTVAVGIFHEFGHATALRYGGGRARGIGAGIYIVYPVFYTDCTDSYRLNRWGRLRTDLGGLYFDLILASGFTIFGALTGNEWLFFLVVLMNLELLWQCLPIGRFDGYWAMADLAGVPDFFSQAKPFLRSLKQDATAGETKLPALKPWARNIFIFYILISMPLLIGFFYFIAKAAPSVILTVIKVERQLAHLLRIAVSESDVLFTAQVLGYMLVFGLPAAGMSYMLVSMSRQIFTGIWRWSQPTAARHVAGGIAMACVVGLLAYLWYPHLPEGRPEPPAGVQSFTVADATHVEGLVSYQQNPPVGGSHNPVWQNCGFYDVPVANEHAVHSLEHGAVWITYRPDLPRDQVAQLEQLAEEMDYILVSPYPGLPAPVVASAWEHQLRLDTATDERLDQFIRVYRKSPKAPEPGATCTGGTSTTAGW